MEALCRRHFGLLIALGNTPRDLRIPRDSHENKLKLRYPMNSSQNPPSDHEASQVDEGGEGGQPPLVAQGQPPEAALQPGEEALHRRPGHAVSGPTEAIGPATPGPPPPPGVLRYAGPDAPPAQVMANLPGVVGAISAQLLWPPPGPAPPAPKPQAPHQLGEGGGIVAVGRAYGHG
jgi:hypothetical protein